MIRRKEIKHRKGMMKGEGQWNFRLGNQRRWQSWQGWGNRHGEEGKFNFGPMNFKASVWYPWRDFLKAAGNLGLEVELRLEAWRTQHRNKWSSREKWKEDRTFGNMYKMQKVGEISYTFNWMYNSLAWEQRPTSLSHFYILTKLNPSLESNILKVLRLKFLCFFPFPLILFIKTLWNILFLSPH